MKRNFELMQVDTEEIENHPEYQHEMNLILKVQKNRLFEAERNRKMQMQNVQALYDFEVENIAAGVKFARDELISQVREQMVKDCDEAEAACIVAAAAAAAATEEANEEENEEDEPQLQLPGEPRRRTRSLGVDPSPAPPLTFEQVLAGLRRKSAGAAPPPRTPPSVPGMPPVLLNRKKRGGKVFGEEVLNNCLSEEDVRADMLAIVHHLEDRAVAMLTQEKDVRPAVTAQVIDDTLTICPPLSPSARKTSAASIDTDTDTESSSQHSASFSPPACSFRTGCMVVVRSSTSAEDLSGTITVLSRDKDDLILRLHAGPRLRVPLEQVRSGRVTITRDVEAYRDMALILAARGRYTDRPAQEEVCA